VLGHAPPRVDEPVRELLRVRGCRRLERERWCLRRYTAIDDRARDDQPELFQAIQHVAVYDARGGCGGDVDLWHALRLRQSHAGDFLVRHESGMDADAEAQRAELRATVRRRGRLPGLQGIR